jgi:hypothetical protein
MQAGQSVAAGHHVAMIGLERYDLGADLEADLREHPRLDRAQTEHLDRSALPNPGDGHLNRPVVQEKHAAADQDAQAGNNKTNLERSFAHLFSIGDLPGDAQTRGIGPPRAAFEIRTRIECLIV